MRTSAPPLLPLFRSRLQGDLLARVLLNAHPTSISDLARELRSPVPTVQREVHRLEAAGIFTSQRVGRARLVTASEANPAVAPLRELVLIALGPRQVVAEEFSGLSDVDSILIFGSWAARYLGEQGPPPRDVDVLVIGTPDRDAVFEAAERAERRLGTPVNTTSVSAARWHAASEPFLQSLQQRPLITVHGEEQR